MVFNATFNNISAISWRSVLLGEETGVFGENYRPVARHWQTWSHTVSSTPCHERGSNCQLWWWYALIAQVLVNPTTIRSRPRRHLVPKGRCFFSIIIAFHCIILKIPRDDIKPIWKSTRSSIHRKFHGQHNDLVIAVTEYLSKKTTCVFHMS